MGDEIRGMEESKKMSAHERQHTLNQDKHKKLKRKKAATQETTNNMQTIRIIYMDPYATDSSDEETSYGPSNPKRVVTEIHIPNIWGGKKGKKPENVGKKQKSSLTKHKGNKTEKVGKKHVTNQQQLSQTKSKGVRLRKWGRWAAEIRDPFQKRRLWLGTFDTKEEATDAYNKKKLEIESKKKNNHSITTAASPIQNQHNTIEDINNILPNDSAAQILESEKTAYFPNINHEHDTSDTMDDSLELFPMRTGVDLDVKYDHPSIEDLKQLPDFFDNLDDNDLFFRLHNDELNDPLDFGSPKHEHSSVKEASNIVQIFGPGTANTTTMDNSLELFQTKTKIGLDVGHDHLFTGDLTEFPGICDNLDDNDLFRLDTDEPIDLPNFDDSLYFDDKEWDNVDKFFNDLGGLF